MILTQVRCGSSWTEIRKEKIVSVKSRKIVQENGWKGMLLVEKRQNRKLCMQPRVNQNVDENPAEGHMTL